MSIEAPQDIPEIWRPYFDRRGIELTFRALERRTQMGSPNTVVRALTGVGTPTRRVATKIGDALGITADEFFRIRSEIVAPGAPVDDPFHLPQRANRLTLADRRTVVSVVDAILGGSHTYDTPTADSTATEPTPNTTTGGTADERLQSIATATHELLADFPTGTKARIHLIAALSGLEAALYEASHSQAAADES